MMVNAYQIGMDQEGEEIQFALTNHLNTSPSHLLLPFLSSSITSSSSLNLQVRKQTTKSFYL